MEILRNHTLVIIKKAFPHNKAAGDQVSIAV